jgi:ribosomal protein S4E
MSEQPRVDYGETVQITSKEHNGRIGAVVGINRSESSRTYTVEFGDKPLLLHLEGSPH